MAFWKDNNTPEPLRAHRWYIEFTNVAPSFKNIKFALKECKKPEYEINVTEHKRLNHVVRLPGILKWKPINIKFASIRGESHNLDAGSVIYDATKKGGYSNPVSFLEGALSKYSMSSALEKGALNIVQVDAEGKPIEVWSLFKAVITNVNFGSLSYESEDLVNIECTITYDYAELNNSSRVTRLKVDINSTNEVQMGNVKAKVPFGIDGKDTTQGGDLKPLQFYYPKDPNWTVKNGNPIVVTASIIPDTEYDIIPPDRFDKAIKLVTAKDANDLGRLIKVSRADNRATSRDLSGQYNEFKDASDGDTGLIFSDTIRDVNGNPISTEEQIRNEQFAKEEAARQAARSQAEEAIRQKQEQELLEKAKAAEEEAKKLEWQRLTAEQDAKDASSNKDNLASNTPQARSKAEQEADKLVYDLEAEQTTSAGSDFNVDEMMASEAAARQKEVDDAAAAQAAKEKETQDRVNESYNKLGNLFDLAEQSENTKEQEEIERKELKDESARLYAEEEIARDDAATAKANETLDTMQKIPESSEENSFDSNSEGSSLYPQLDENGNVAGTVNYQQNNEFINDEQEAQYGPEAPTEEQWAEMNSQQEAQYGPEAPTEEQWEQMTSDEKKRNESSTSQYKNDTTSKANSSGEQVKPNTTSSSNKAFDPYGDDQFMGSGPKMDTLPFAGDESKPKDKPSTAFDKTLESEYFFDTRSSNTAGYNQWKSDRENSSVEELERYLSGQKELEKNLSKEKISEMAKAGRNYEGVESKYKYPQKALKDEIKFVEGVLATKKGG